jgi:putative flippase GtrA
VSTTLRHWLKFNAVGIIGVVVQLIVLTILKTVLGMNYLLATVLAVEAAILHNFVWHERWTWIDRTTKVRGRLQRLLRFNTANGLISLIGNVGMMWLLVSKFNLHYLVSNLVAVIVCSLVNFLVSDRLVFNSQLR